MALVGQFPELKRSGFIEAHPSAPNPNRTPRFPELKRSGFIEASVALLPRQQRQIVSGAETLRLH